MNVICVRQGDKFSKDYVIMLRRMVAEHLKNPLFVLGDGDDADLPLQHGYKGWWAKLELFSPEVKALRPFLYFDLDTFILSDATRLLEAPGRLTLIRDFNREQRGNSGVMQIPKDTDDIWTLRRTDIADGDYLDNHAHDYIQDKYPGMVSSYKKHSRETPMSPVVCFHGQPKPHQADGWAKEIWNAYTR